MLASPIELIAPDGLAEAAWENSEQFGWAKTYDAQYVALARLLDCRLVNLASRKPGGRSPEVAGGHRVS
jgi:predicted nucleic acid-binding protein